MSGQAYYNKGFSKLISDTHSWRNVINAVPYIIPYLNKNQKLLDVGCGPGTILKDLGQYVKQVVGIETLPELVELAKSQADLPENVEFQQGLAYELPFEDNSFDVVHALQVVVHLSDPSAGLKEMLRVCKKGGFVCVKDGDLSLTTVYPEEYAEIFHESTPARGTTLKIAGRLMKHRALDAGYEDKNITMSGLVWYISSEEDRRRFRDMFEARIRKGNEFEEAKYDQATMIGNLHKWAEDARSTLMFVHGEMVYRK